MESVFCRTQGATYVLEFKRKVKSLFNDLTDILKNC